MNKDTWYWLASVLLALVLVAYLVIWLNGAIQCSNDGGVWVQGFPWWVCTS